MKINRFEVSIADVINDHIFDDEEIIALKIDGAGEHLTLMQLIDRCTTALAAAGWTIEFMSTQGAVIWLDVVRAAP